MIGAGHSTEEAVEVTEVMRAAGFVGPCELALRAQGEGIGIIVIQATIPLFLQPFIKPVADGAAERLKQFFWELQRTTRWGRESRLQQLYIRPDAVSNAEWKQTGRHGRLPGWRQENPDEPELVMTSLMPGEAWDALVALDPDALEPGASYWWSDEHCEWRPSGGP